MLIISRRWWQADTLSSSRWPLPAAEEQVPHPHSQSCARANLIISRCPPCGPQRKAVSSVATAVGMQGKGGKPRRQRTNQANGSVGSREGSGSQGKCSVSPPPRSCRCVRETHTCDHSPSPSAQFKILFQRLTSIRGRGRFERNPQQRPTILESALIPRGFVRGVAVSPSRKEEIQHGAAV